MSIVTRASLLIPTAVAERCYLNEALLWVALQRIPRSYATAYECDAREHSDYENGLELVIEEAEEGALVGLPTNPEYEDYERGELHQKPEHLRQMLGLAFTDEEDPEIKKARAKWKEELSESLAFYERQAAWDKEFESFLEIPKAKLFLALREGRVHASGKQLICPTVAEALEHDRGPWCSDDWVAIPAEFWMFQSIDWMAASAEGRSTGYGLILVDTESLFASFPPPFQTPVANVVKVGPAFLLLADDERPNVNPVVRGRPPLDWDAFHVEVARRLREGELPQKQEALIAEMQEWCKAKWHRSVGRSTLLQKLKPYYDQFVRASENQGKCISDLSNLISRPHKPNL